MKRFTLVFTVAALALVVVAMGSAAILPPKTHGHDDLGKWAKKFFVFDASVPVVGGSHPALDAGDVDCGLGQHGKTWFLETAPSIEGDFERRCSVPEKTTLYVPVFQWICSPQLDGIDVAPCLTDADGVFEAIELGLSIDGQTLDDAALDAYRAATGRFDLKLVEDSFWEFLCECELEKSIDFGADVIGVLVGDLAVGPHEIVISYESTDLDFEGSLTYQITVEKKKKH